MKPHRFAHNETRHLSKGKFVFLGGTVGNNPWRDEFIATMSDKGIPAESLFNPVVPIWDPDVDGPREDAAKRQAKYHLYYLTSPQSTDSEVSAFSTAEAIVSLQQRLRSTVVVFGDFEESKQHVRKQMVETERILRLRFPDAIILPDLQAAADWLAPRLSAIGDPDQPHNRAWRRDTFKVWWLKWHIARLLNNGHNSSVSIDRYDCRHGVWQNTDTLDFERIAARAAESLNQSGLHASVIHGRGELYLQVSRM